MASKTDETWKSHWKCFVACGVIVLSPFQYGVDFGLIGGLQAMVGFLEVRRPSLLSAMMLTLFPSRRSTATEHPRHHWGGTSTRPDSSSSRRS
jgi:hypothetical protein